MTTVAYLVLGCRVLLVIVFVVSLVGKVRGRDAFDEFVGATRRLLPITVRARPAWLVALGVAGLETVVVLALLLPGGARVGFLLAAMMLTAFTLAILVALRRGERAPCRCFGASSTRPLGIVPIVRNAVLLTVTVLGVIGVALTPATAFAPAGVAVAAVAAVVVAVPVILSEEIVDLFRAPTVGHPAPERPDNTRPRESAGRK